MPEEIGSNLKDGDTAALAALRSLRDQEPHGSYVEVTNTRPGAKESLCFYCGSFHGMFSGAPLLVSCRFEILETRRRGGQRHPVLSC